MRPMTAGKNTASLADLAARITETWTDADNTEAAYQAAIAAEDAASKHYEDVLATYGAAQVAFETASRESKGACKADEDTRLKLGALLVEAKAQCKHGEWKTWFEANVPDRSYRDAQKLMKIASSPDPTAAREKEKADNREAQQRSRSAKASDVSRISNFDPTSPTPSPELWSAQVDKVVAGHNAPAVDPTRGEVTLAIAKAAVAVLDATDFVAFVTWFGVHRSESRGPDGAKKEAWVKPEVTRIEPEIVVIKPEVTTVTYPAPADTLAAAYELQSPEDQKRARDWVMRRLHTGENPAGDELTEFLASYLGATAQAQQAFRARLVAA